MPLQAPRNSGLQAFIIGPLQARASAGLAVGYIDDLSMSAGVWSFGDNFNRADGALDDPPTHDYVSVLKVVVRDQTAFPDFTTPLTPDEFGRAMVTVTDEAVPVVVAFKIYQRDQPRTEFNWHARIDADLDVGGGPIRAGIRWLESDNGWRFIYEGVTQGPISGIVSGYPTQGALLTITFEAAQISYSFDGNTDTTPYGGGRTLDHAHEAGFWLAQYEP